jgi:hypothetical protein
VIACTLTDITFNNNRLQRFGGDMAEKGRAEVLVKL